MANIYKEVLNATHPELASAIPVIYSIAASDNAKKFMNKEELQDSLTNFAKEISDHFKEILVNNFPTDSQEDKQKINQIQISINGFLKKSIKKVIENPNANSDKPKS